MKIKLSKSQWEGIGKKAGMLEQIDPSIKMNDYKYDISSNFGQLVERTRNIAKITNPEQRKQTIEQLPHMLILRGEPGTGKSVYAHALADLLGTQVNRINLADVFDKWVGNSEKETDKLIQTIFSSRNVVFLIDEVDRMSGGDSGGGGVGSEGHPTEKKVIAKFLEAFGERLGELVSRGVFIIMTTNHVNAIDNALLKRTKGDVYEVPGPSRRQPEIEAEPIKLDINKPLPQLASNKMKIKLSRSQWELVGKKAGWMKKAAIDKNIKVAAAKIPSDPNNYAVGKIPSDPNNHAVVYLDTDGPVLYIIKKTDPLDIPKILYNPRLKFKSEMEAKAYLDRSGLGSLWEEAKTPQAIEKYKLIQHENRRLWQSRRESEGKGLKGKPGVPRPYGEYNLDTSNVESSTSAVQTAKIKSIKVIKT